MLLQQFFAPARIAIGLESEDKDELFEELVDLLTRTGGRDFPRAAVLRGVRDREAKMSTGIKKGIAVPHGKAAGLSAIVGAIGVSRKGIDYEALDGEPVYLVFMMVSPPDNPELHLGALKRLARLLEDPEFTAELLDAESPAQAWATLKRFEDMLAP